MTEQIGFDKHFRLIVDTNIGGFERIIVLPNSTQRPHSAKKDTLYISGYPVHKGLIFRVYRFERGRWVSIVLDRVSSAALNEINGFSVPQDNEAFVEILRSEKELFKAILQFCGGDKPTKKEYVSLIDKNMKPFSDLTAWQVLDVLPVKFFDTPWAEFGDTSPIPDTIQIDGSVNYPQGFTPPYSQSPVNSPGARPVPRTAMNQVLYDVTNALSQYQTRSVPYFITAADNGGSPYPYGKYAHVLYDPLAGTNYIEYISLVANNTAIPTNTMAWAPLTLTNTNVYIDAATFDLAVGQGDVVSFNPTSGNYTQAIATGTALGLVLGIADVANSRVLLLGQYTGYTGLIIGAQYFLSSSTLGGQVAVPPSANVVSLGVATSTTTLQFNPQPLYVPGSQLFTSNGNITVPYGVYVMFATACPGGGGGGGSGGANATTATGSSGTGGGGGGGSGDQVERVPISVIPGTVLSANIGAPGIGGAAGTNTINGGTGSPGGITSLYNGVTPLLILNPGNGGNGSPVYVNSTAYHPAGNGAANGGNAGQLGMTFRDGDGNARVYAGSGGPGANSLFGIGGGTPLAVGLDSPGSSPGVAGNNATRYGAGGSGASGCAALTMPATTTPGAIGGNGAPGFLLLEW